MIYLRTGANGAGKTLLTLKEVREKSIKESRPVYHNGRFKVAEDGPLADWKVIDAKDWQTVPDGAIFLFDECHKDFPPRSPSSAVPPYVQMLAEHRSRGFDFYLITQHPGNFDKFIRNIIGSPGWHQHLKRASGAPLVSVLQWAAVNDQPQKNGSGASAQVSMVPYPKEVYGWYQSTSLDTAKVKIPFQAKLLVFALLAVPAMGYLAYSRYMHQFSKENVAHQLGIPASGSGVVGNGGAGVVEAKPAVMTPAEYLASYTPRVVGLAYSAPRYDALTVPVNAPFPAGCVSMGSRCTCYTEQGTKIDTTNAICVQIVKDGYFKDWGSVGHVDQHPVVASGAVSKSL